MSKRKVLSLILTMVLTMLSLTACDNNPQIDVENNITINTTPIATTENMMSETEADRESAEADMSEDKGEIETIENDNVDLDSSAAETGSTEMPDDSDEETKEDKTEEIIVEVTTQTTAPSETKSEEPHKVAVEPTTATAPQETVAENNSTNITPEQPSELLVEKPVVTFTDVDEYMYVTADSLNVRTGPGVEYDRVTSIPKNTKVHRVAVGDNRWSKVEIDGKILYVSSNYLSPEPVKVVVQQSSKPTNETVAEEMARRGSIGRLTIPSVGLSVALFQTTIWHGSQSQPVVDAVDSAAYMPDAVDCFRQIIIADHVHQGFSAIKSAVPGSTYAYIDFGTYTNSYICTNKFIGYNNGHGLTDLNGVSITGQNDGGTCMYTCNADGTITITYWQPA